MKKLVPFIIAFVFGFQFINAQLQTCDCKTDLDFIVEKMKKMPSYKKQIKGEKLDKFNTTYNNNSSKMENPLPIEDCYKLLLEQMNLVNDVHASLQANNAYSKITINELQTNIEALKETLNNKPLEAAEGIYKFNNELIGLQYIKGTNDLVGIVLETDLENWTVGETRFTMTHTNANKYNMYYYNSKTRKPGFVKSMSLENGRIWSYKKVGNTNNFELPTDDAEVASFRQINDNVQYLYFATFGNNTKDKLTADNIIVDLRSNRGGNSKFSDPFLKFLKNKNVYVITNAFAGSNGEQFTLKLLKNKNAKHLGQKSRGIIAYGMNYGYRYNTPSEYFKMMPTDMNFHKYIEYEGKGVSPEIPLDFSRDWIEQTLEIIEKDSN